MSFLNFNSVIVMENIWIGTLSVPPRVFEVPGSDRDAISIYREFVYCRPIDQCQDDSPFYIQPIPPSRINSILWFYPRPIGKNKLGSFKQRAAKFMSFAGRKTNPSVRKTTVQTLSKAGVPPQQIIKITGHKTSQAFNTMTPFPSMTIAEFLAYLF